MKFEVQSSFSLAFLSIVNMCLCLQDIAEKTLNTLGTEIMQAARHQHPHHPIAGIDDSTPTHYTHFSPADKPQDFLLVDYLADGEMERRISYNGLTAKETSLGNSTKSLSLWQLSNGAAFIQMIYSKDDDLLDCEYVRQKGFVHGFLKQFYDEVGVAQARNFSAPTGNTANGGQHRLRHHSAMDETLDDFSALTNPAALSLQYDRAPLDGDDDDLTPTASKDAFGMRTLEYKQVRSEADIPSDMLPMLDYQNLKAQCDIRHKQMKRIVHDMSSEHEERRTAATETLERKKRALADWFIAPNTKWCGRGHSAAKYSHLGGASKADKCCRRHDHCRFNIHSMTTKWHMFNYRPFTISHCSCDMSQRRDLSNLLRVPGTKWCGKGWSATKYTDLGGFSKADRCCRQHDKSCPFWIMGFETKYGFFNWRVNTLMHCKCDERFRTCLKMADSSDATMVGKLFFNIVQSKCFVLKPEKTCKQRSWWGKCEKKVTRKRAHLRDNRKF